jgi:hypothetical protein
VPPRPDHQIAARLDGQHQDAPVPHTIRYAVGDNRIDITLDDDDSREYVFVARR